jgi:hypothetical protein
MHNLKGFLIALVFLSACQGVVREPLIDLPTPTVAIDPPPIVATLEPEPPDDPPATSTVPPKPTNTITPLPTLPVVVHKESGPSYDLVFSIPVGEGGVRYRGVGTESMEITGPNALAALPDGRWIIADLLDNRLLYYTPDGKFEKAVDLSDLGIVNVSDLLLAPGWLYLKEISFDISPMRYRVNRLTLEGDLIEFYDIPEVFRLADNLPGLTVDGEGRLLLDAETFGVSPEGDDSLDGNVIQLVDPQGNWSPQPMSGVTHFGRVYRHFPTTIAENRSIVIAGDLRVETGLTLGFGSLRLLHVLPDGRFFLIREDLFQDTPMIQVDQTVHFLSADGEQLGVARYPLTERFYHVERGITLGSDGGVYALLPRRTSLDVIRLTLYTNLEPLIPSAADPLVIQDFQ